MKLWQKHWQLDKIVEAFETKDDLVLDGHLVRADVIGSLAQAEGLHRIDLLTKEEVGFLRGGFQTILQLDKEGKFPLGAGDEDIHTKIENWLTAHVGDVGKKIHTGRSRNDQVATSVRVYTKEQLHEIIQALLSLTTGFVSFAQKYEKVPMPGYTHMQRAMPSSVGLWAGAFAEGIMDSLAILESAYRLVDQSPLGSAAGYGVPIAHDRVFTAKQMGFARVQNNSLYCQNGRGIIEASVVAALVSVLQHLSKFASDLLLFTTKEFDMFIVADELCSGSSIMPQKRNVDVAELIRSKVHSVPGHYMALVGISSNLISGYNRDLQDTKRPLFESLWTTKDTIVASWRLLCGLAPNPTRLREMMSSEIYVTHHTLGQVTQGIAFRDAYKEASQTVAGKKQNNKSAKTSTNHDMSMEQYGSALEIDRISSILEQSTHLGSTGNLGISAVSRTVKGRVRVWDRTIKTYNKTVDDLVAGSMV